MNWWWLLALWPILGWTRLYFVLKEEKRRSKGRVVIEDYSVYIQAAIWPFF